VSVVQANLLGIPDTGAPGAGKDIDFWTDYGTSGEAPTAHQQSDLVSTYTIGAAGIISVIRDLASLLTNAVGGDIVGLEIKHNTIGGAIEYLGVNIVFEELSD
jgi:hypothetical protein